MNIFCVGDQVKWTSQSNGCTKEKLGEIVLVISAGTQAIDLIPKEWHSITSPYARPVIGYLSNRDHESYIVAVPTKSGKGKLHLYWPLVKNLVLVKEAE